MQKYITSSIELNMFFSRIMKEHAIFLEAGFPGKDKEFIEEADWYKNEFEKILTEVVKIARGDIRPTVLNSGEIVTEYTLSTEEKTEYLTGISIDKNITIMENNLRIDGNYTREENKEIAVKNINNKAIKLLDGLIEFKERILSEMLSCNIYNANYPLLIDHILREAKLYRSYLIELENGQDVEFEDIKNQELFWDQIMMEHALFIRGLLDPTENELINKANDFAQDYVDLMDETKNLTTETMKSITDKTIKQTLEYRDFKITGTKGLDSCEIKSIILPLLADHVLREANHYLRILRG